MSETGLATYYPHIHIRNTSWLKNALLYWDCIQRIVPTDYPNESSDPLSSKEFQLLSREGLVERISPKPYVKEAEKRFKETWGALTSTDDCTSGIEWMWRRLGDRKTDALAGSLKSYLETDPDHRWIDMYSEKMSDGIFCTLRELGYAADKKNGVIHLRKSIFDIYMMSLASTIKDHIGSDLVSDDRDTASAALSLESLASNETGPMSSALQLAFECISFSTDRDVPVEKLIRFHQKSHGNRRAFRQSIKEITDTCVGIEDPHRLRHYLRQQSNGIRPDGSVIAISERA